jgi:N utilization substance protein A
MKSDFLIAVTQLAAERDLPRDIVLSAIEAALVSAYRKDSVATGQNISVKLDPATGDVSVSVLKTVVEEIEDPQQDVLLADARKLMPEAEIGDSVATETIPHSAGRIAAQTAKQVVIQRLREAERELVYEEFADKQGEVFSVNIQRIEPKQLVVELGRGEAILPPSEQVPYERYRVGQKMKVLLQSVQRSGKGPELIVSRADTLLLKRLFEMEVPEIFNGAVEIVAISREPGSRSKVAVRATQDRVDPVGSCVGLRGVRIQNIVNELHGEKIDVVEWNKDPSRFIANALNPSQVMRVELDHDTQSASAVVPDRQLSLAIGKEGQNARLAAKLTGWSVDIKSNVEVDAKSLEAARILAEAAELIEGDIDELGLATRALNNLKAGGVAKVRQVLDMSKSELLAIKSFGQKSYDELYARLDVLGLLSLEEAAAAAADKVSEEEALPEPTITDLEQLGLTTMTLNRLKAGGVGDLSQVIEMTKVDLLAVKGFGEKSYGELIGRLETLDLLRPAVETLPEDVTDEVEAPVAEAAPEVAVVEVEDEAVASVEPELTAEAAAEVLVQPEEKPQAVEEEPEPIPELVKMVEPAREPVPVLDQSSSIRDVSSDVFSVRRAPIIEPGVIRFAEDIDGLRGGVTVRQGRRRDAGGAGSGRGRKSKARRRR